MATFTPNYNLGKPEPTDPFGYNSFLPLFNENMEIIDENMGGGGGSGNVDDVEVNGVSVLDPVTKIAEITSYEEVTQAEYNALPDDKLSDGIAYFIKDSVNGADGFPPLIYSFEERQVGVWADGKPLYQKTISKNNIDMGNNAGTYTSIPHGISDFDFCVDLEIICPRLNISAKDQLREFANFKADATNVFCAWGTNYYSRAVDRYWYITILYTKTTDVAGSGDWTPSGASAVHYSENEQVIGTWIDGKPLYEITSRITQDLSLTANTWVKSQFDQGTKKALYKTMIVNDSGAVIDNVAGGFVDDKIAINSPRTLTVLANTGYLIMQYTKTTD